MFLGINDLLSLLDQRGSGDFIEAVLRSRQRMEADFMDLLIVDAQGRIQFWTGTGEPPPIDHLHVTSGFRNNDGIWTIGPPQWSRAHNNQRFFAVSRTFRDPGGRSRHMLVALLDLQSMPKAYDDLPDQAMRLTMRDPWHHTYFTVTRETPAIPLWRRASVWFGDQVPITATVNIAGTPLQIHVSQSADAVLQPWITNMLVNLGLWILITAAMIWAFRQFSRQQDRLNFLATTDALSHLSNRRHFMNLGRELFLQSRRYQQPLSALILDIDNFKQVNDRYGHSQGDNAIRAVADLLRKHCRESDVVGRMGGEEFIMLLPNTPLTGALTTANKLLKEVEAHLLGQEKPFSITVSIGASGLRPDDASLETLINRADQALYRAKQAGKNRVSHLSTGLPCL